MTSISTPEIFFQYCPRCGKQTLRHAEERSVLCTACGFHYFFNVATAVSGIIRADNGTILLAKRGRNPGKGLWDTPGGFMNPGESAEETLQREIREETGMAVTEIQYFTSAPNMYVFENVLYSLADLTFLCRTLDGVGQPQPQDDEITDLAYFAVKDIPIHDIAFPSVRKALELFQSLQQE